MISRRNFLKFACFSSLLACTNLSFSNSIEKKILIFIDLFGGSDGLNMLIPYTDQNYYSLRPNVAISNNEMLKLNNLYAVNHNLKDTYYDWYKNNNAIFFPRAGQEINSRSHFLATDILGSGNNNPKSDDGFLARLSEVLSKSEAVSFTENEKIFTRSKNKIIPSIGVNQLDGRYLEYSNKNNFTNLKNNFEAINKSNKVIENVKNSINSSEDGNLYKIGQFINNSKTDIIFYENLGWDTHANQNERLKVKLTELNGELLKLRKSLGQKWNDTAIVVMSEFGRTLRDNGDGTEHGFGNLISIFGGLIKKSQIIGGVEKLTSNNLNENRELKVEYSYRDILRTLLSEMYNLNTNELDYVLPGSKLLDIRIT